MQLGQQPNDENTDAADAADAWGTGITGITVVPNTNYGDTWGTDSKPTAAGNEANGHSANNGWSGDGGWKGDKASNDDHGYVTGAFRRDWQPFESDGGRDGFRKVSRYVAHSFSFSVFITLIIPCGRRGNRYHCQDSSRGQNDNGRWETYTTGRRTTQPAWGGANYATMNSLMGRQPRCKIEK